MTQTVNGPHDLGGLPGFGAVPMGDESASPFPEGWEGRTTGAIIASIVAGLFNVDQFRAGIEALPPVAYVKASYWEKWLHTLEYNLLRNSVLSEEEIEGRLQEVAADPEAPLPERSDPDRVAVIAGLIEGGAPITRALERDPAFGPGDRVRTREILVERRGEQHTRLPGYAQGIEGVIEIVHPAMPLPDASAVGEPERAEPVYAVRFRGRDLWPDAEDASSVCVDLWESYLEPA